MIGLVVSLVLALLPGGYSDLGPCGRLTVDETNRHRQEAGLRPLQVDWGMHIYALKWARVQRDAYDTFHHEYPRYSENVGQSTDPLSLNVAWWESAGHRSNILDPRYRYIGPGCANGGGRTFGTVTFR